MLCKTGHWTERDTEWWFYLLYKLQAAGLIERNKCNIKKVDHIPNRSNQLTHLDDQPVGPITTYTWPGTPVKTLNIINVEGRQGRQTDIPLTLTMGQSAVLLRTPSPLTPGKDIIYRNCNRISHWDRWVTWTPWWGGTTESPMGSYPATSWTCWNTLYVVWNTKQSKRGEGGGRGLAYPPPAHLLTPDSAAIPHPPTCMVCTTLSNS